MSEPNMFTTTLPHQPSVFGQNFADFQSKNWTTLPSMFPSLLSVPEDPSDVQCLQACPFLLTTYAVSASSLLLALAHSNLPKAFATSSTHVFLLIPFPEHQSSSTESTRRLHDIAVITNHTKQYARLYIFA